MAKIVRRNVLAAIGLSAGIGLPANVAFAQAAVEVIVPVAPPPPPKEVIPVLPPERVEREHWQSGYWRWNGREYVWVPGRYVERPFKAAVWVPGHWDKRPGGWIFVEGHWR